ncbi:hypothetical protein [Escherichia coli]|uniref:hypothetical protein n=1 Tax=Escherichia coli TaxID=562 RepID=UPI000BE5B5D5|nr:hypothetical protein [Escherichia coli]
MNILNAFGMPPDLYKKWLESLPEKEREDWERDASLRDAFKKKSDLENQWVALLPEDEKEARRRAALELKRVGIDFYAGESDRIDKFVEDLLAAPICTPVTEIPGFLDGMEIRELVNGVRRHLNSVRGGKARGVVVKDCYAEAYNAVMAENDGRRPRLKAVLFKLKELADNADRAGDFNYPINSDEVDLGGTQIGDPDGQSFGSKAIGRWHAKLNKKYFPT